MFLRHRWAVGIGQKNNGSLPVCVCKCRVGLPHLFDGISPTYERSDVKSLFRHKPKIFTHVAILCPSDVGNRIIETPLFIGPIISAWAVGR